MIMISHQHECMNPQVKPEHAGMEMQGNRALPVLFSNELDRLQEPFRVIEMAMRKDDGLDSTELQAHPASVPFDGIGIGARVEKDCPLLSVCARSFQRNRSSRVLLKYANQAE